MDSLGYPGEDKLKRGDLVLVPGNFLKCIYAQKSEIFIGLVLRYNEPLTSTHGYHVVQVLCCNSIEELYFNSGEIKKVNM